MIEESEAAIIKSRYFKAQCQISPPPPPNTAAPPRLPPDDVVFSCLVGNSIDCANHGAYLYGQSGSKPVSRVRESRPADC